MSQRVNVRTVAEFYCEGGDLSREGDLYARMQEGSRAHRALQSLYPEGYRAEVAVSLPVEEEGVEFQLFGRIDGLWEQEGCPVIEEIKSTLRPAHELQADDYPVHWAQAQLYAAILCEKEGHPGARVRLRYCQVGSLETTLFERQYTAEALRDLLHTYLRPLARWTAALMSHWQARQPTLKALCFPFESYRDGQREMAVNIYLALRNKKRLLCQAPTGIGKTAASLFPALKALGEQKISQVFFLTARSTGSRAAQTALQNMRRQGLSVRSVTLLARDKVCPMAEEQRDCDPAVCPRARGYYDRLRGALYEALFTDHFGTEQVAQLAERHELCPFELSLDLSELADVVICDYNYVFDPRVKLKRFFTGKSDAALLIDEAHNLPARAREMLSAALAEHELELLRRRIGKAESRKHPLYRALSALLAPFKALRAAHPDEAAEEALPQELTEQVRLFTECAAGFLNHPGEYSGALWDAYFAALDFLAVAGRYDEHYRTLYFMQESRLSVRLWCADPSAHLSEALGKVHGTALFSATLSPLPFYRDLLGLSEQAGDALLELPSPFPPENLSLYPVRLNMRYKQREAAIEPLADLLLRAVQDRPGNYMACFPSYRFMQQVYDALQAKCSGVRLHIQSPQMSEFARQDFLAQFQEHPEEPLLALIVMGGVFAEGIDLPGSLLSGAFIVGTGVPQICLENDTLRALYEKKFGAGMGYRYAYLYPGLTRVFQAAGRVIRTETDVGFVYLIDTRWFDAEHRASLKNMAGTICRAPAPMTDATEECRARLPQAAE